MSIINDFIRDNGPAVILLDVQGRRNPVAGLHRALEAIEAANDLQAAGGTCKIVDAASDLETQKTDNDAVLLYYTSHNGKPTKEEIARVARVLSRSDIPNNVIRINGSCMPVRGSRAVVFPEMLPPTAVTAAFLVSTRVWYNQNRSIIGFPAGESHEEAFLTDINVRLTEGSVSLPR